MLSRVWLYGTMLEHQLELTFCTLVSPTQQIPLLSRAQLVAAPAPHMSPITRRQSQRHTPLPRPRGMVTAPKPTYSQVVTGLARDPGKGHVTVARDPGKGHVTVAR